MTKLNRNPPEKYKPHKFLPDYGPNPEVSIHPPKPMMHILDAAAQDA